MTAAQFDGLRFAKSGEMFRERLRAAGGRVLADDTGAMFRDMTTGYRCLFTMSDGQVWQAAQFTPTSKGGEFTILKATDSPENRARYAGAEWGQVEGDAPREARGYIEGQGSMTQRSRFDGTLQLAYAIVVYGLGWVFVGQGALVIGGVLVVSSALLGAFAVEFLTRREQ